MRREFEDDADGGDGGDGGSGASNPAGADGTGSGKGGFAGEGGAGSGSGEGGTGSGSGEGGTGTGSGEGGTGSGEGGTGGVGASDGAAAGVDNGGSASGRGSGEAGMGGEAEPLPCGGLVCLHGGECSSDGASCDCASTGYEGVTCDQNVDECKKAPCANATQCTDTPGSYTCDCSSAPNYTGSHCDLLRFEPLPETFIPRDISPDGAVVVGADKNTIGYKYVDGKAVFLGFLIGENASAAYGASANGKVIVGASGTNFLWDTSTAVRWDGPDVTALQVAEGYTNCVATGVSADGRVIGGTCVNDGYKAVRWEDGVFEPIGTAEGVETCSDVVVSDDGSTIAGRCSIYPANRGFVWTKSSGFKLLPTTPTASNCNLTDLSADGKAAVGNCVKGIAGPGSAYLWTAAGGTNPLLNGEDVINGYGVAVSANGKRVLGSDGGAALWDDPQAGSTPLIARLPAATPGLADWVLGLPIAMSADGKTIVGEGTLQSTTRRYIARID